MWARPSGREEELTLVMAGVGAAAHLGPPWWPCQQQGPPSGCSWDVILAIVAVCWPFRSSSIYGSQALSSNPFFHFAQWMMPSQWWFPNTKLFKITDHPLEPGLEDEWVKAGRLMRGSYLRTWGWRWERKKYLGGKIDWSLMIGDLILSLNLEDKNEFSVLCAVLVAFQGYVSILLARYVPPNEWRSKKSLWNRIVSGVQLGCGLLHFKSFQLNKHSAFSRC